jgi:hypothetical protein
VSTQTDASEFRDAHTDASEVESTCFFSPVKESKVREQTLHSILLDQLIVIAHIPTAARGFSENNSDVNDTILIPCFTHKHSHTVFSPVIARLRTSFRKGFTTLNQANKAHTHHQGTHTHLHSHAPLTRHTHTYIAKPKHAHTCLAPGVSPVPMIPPRMLKSKSLSEPPAWPCFSVCNVSSSSLCAQWLRARRCGACSEVSVQQVVCI